MFQFTHPRGVRFITRKYFFVWAVSIHAPARGAISTESFIRSTFCFNSRTREGCDQSDAATDKLKAVSIHAPARGAISSMLTATQTLKFQFTHPRGVRSFTSLSLTRSVMFQFTHPRGVRFKMAVFDSINKRFNSRTREGCDSVLYSFKRTVTFQFTHPRGVRCSQPSNCSCCSCFNSRTREGCDLLTQICL